MQRLGLRQKRQMPFGTPVRVMPLRPALITRNVLQLLRHRPLEHLRHVGLQPLMTIVLFINILALFLILRIYLTAVYRLVPVLAAKMTNNNRRLLLVLQILVGRRGQLEPRVHVLAVGPVGAKSGHVVGAEHAPHVAVPAVRPVPAEAAVVPRAVFYFALGVDVQERALLVVARVEPRVEVALGHFGHVVFVQELALIALFAEAAQPVLAHDRAVAADVSERAVGALLTAHRGAIELTYGCCRFYKIYN